MNQPQSVSDLSKDLTGDMPEASDHLADQSPGDTAAGAAGVQSKATAPADPAGKSKPDGRGKTDKSINFAEFVHLRDKHGFRFDPAIHKTKADGTPKVTGAGLLWRKPGVRPKQSNSFVHQGGPQPAAPGIDAAQPDAGTEAAHYQAAGQVMTETLVHIGVILFGEEWRAADAEKTGMADAWGHYFQAKGIHDIPPGIAVSIAMAGYALPRFGQQKTRSRLGRLAAWWKNRKNKPQPPPPAEAPEVT